MSRSVYIESSVISYLAARPSRDLVIAGHQAVTAGWWDNHRLRYDVLVSPLVVEESSAGDALAAEERLWVIADIPSISIAADAESLASALLASNAVPANCARDALHEVSHECKRPSWASPHRRFPKATVRNRARSSDLLEAHYSLTNIALPDTVSAVTGIAYR